MSGHHHRIAALNAATHLGAHPVAVHLRFRSGRGRSARRHFRRRRSSATSAVLQFASAHAEGHELEIAATVTGVAQHSQRQTGAGGFGIGFAVGKLCLCDRTTHFINRMTLGVLQRHNRQAYVWYTPLCPRQHIIQTPDVSTRFMYAH